MKVGWAKENEKPEKGGRYRVEKVRENGDSEENRGLDVTCARIKLEKKKENEKKRRETGKRGWNREDRVLKVGRKVEREVNVRESGKENEGE